MEQNRDILTPPQPLKADSSLDTTAKDGVPHIEQAAKSLPLQQPLEIKWKPGPATKVKAPMTRANWVNAFWADISGQLRRLAVISSDLFDGLLLKRDTATGSFILGELRDKYEEFGDVRTLVSVRVLVPERLMGGMWQLQWTIKRERDPNGRHFHSVTPIDPINYESHLQLENNPGQTISVAGLSLPPFIQDFGPGPSDFDPEPEDEFDAMVRGIIKDVNDGKWVED